MGLKSQMPVFSINQLKRAFTIKFFVLSFRLCGDMSSCGKQERIASSTFLRVDINSNWSTRRSTVGPRQLWSFRYLTWNVFGDRYWCSHYRVHNRTVGASQVEGV